MELILGLSVSGCWILFLSLCCIVCCCGRRSCKSGYKEGFVYASPLHGHDVTVHHDSHTQTNITSASPRQGQDVAVHHDNHTQTNITSASPRQGQDVIVYHDNHTQTNIPSIIRQIEQTSANQPPTSGSRTGAKTMTCSVDKKSRAVSFQSNDDHIPEIKLNLPVQNNDYITRTERFGGNTRKISNPDSKNSKSNLVNMKLRSEKNSTVIEGTEKGKHKKGKGNINTRQNRGRTEIHSPVETLPTISGSLISARKIGNTIYIRSTDLLSPSVYLPDTQAPKRHETRITMDPDNDTRDSKDDRKPPPSYEELQNLRSTNETSGSSVTERTNLQLDHVTLPEILDLSSDAVAHFSCQHCLDDKKSIPSYRELQIANVSNEISDELVPSDCDYSPEQTSFLSNFSDLPELGMMQLKPAVIVQCED